MENKYTVIVKYPDYLNDFETCCQHVSAKSPKHAATAVQRELAREHNLTKGEADDFLVIAVFEGYLHDLGDN